ncbi:NlpC/P60 family protein [Nocardioides immobilis]|uniref:NlpC/P60 family protein n=1 Tax=Nocardioides immobilis TaxID=2049295 RepID=A0A417Y2F5_9ACTN|nr:C40 family peptidase [Nocardioides immobilis]RHW26839.1 NlpC/P60 family protein [Nocardioides immobilis]
MRTFSLRAVARRTALAAAAATTAAVLAPTAASAMPAPAQSHLDDPTAVDKADRKQHRNPHRKERPAVEPTFGEQVLDLASQEAGDPYVWAAAGPDAFDCSGFTQYVFAQVGVSLPHSSSAQAGMVQPVSDPQPGDLVFFTGSGGVYHVGIYAGDNSLWHAPRSGDVVSLDPIWTSSVFYGRVS